MHDSLDHLRDTIVVRRKRSEAQRIVIGPKMDLERVVHVKGDGEMRMGHGKSDESLDSTMGAIYYSGRSVLHPRIYVSRPTLSRIFKSN